MSRLIPGRDRPSPAPAQLTAFARALATVLGRVARSAAGPDGGVAAPDVPTADRGGPARRPPLASSGEPSSAAPGGAAAARPLPRPVDDVEEGEAGAGAAARPGSVGDPGDPGDAGDAGDLAVGDPAMGDPAVPDPADLGDPALGDPAVSDPAVADPADPAAGDPADPAGPDAAALWAAHHAAPGPRTRAALVLHHLPLVRAVAHRTAGRLPAHVDPADLVQSGVFGLLEAIERFDPDRGTRFESYAAARVRGAVLDELRAQDWVPRSVRLRARDAERAREHLARRLRRAPAEREVADALGVTPRELAGPMLLVSVEALRAGAAGTVLDAVPGDCPDPAATLHEQETRRRLWLTVAELEERDRLVVRLYYLENRTLAEIGRTLGVTESRVCQLHTRLVDRLRARLQEQLAG